MFTTDPERGTANFAGADQVRDAAGLVSTGEVFSLDYALNAFDPPMARARGVPHHEILSSHPEARDDVLREFFLQATTQVDGLRHRRASGYGFYNGIPDDLIDVGTPALGIQRWAEKPIVGRGVLIDIEGWAAGAGDPLDHFAGPALPASCLDDALRGPGHRTATRRPGPGAHRMGELVPRRRQHHPRRRSGTPAAAPDSGKASTCRNGCGTTRSPCSPPTPSPSRCFPWSPTAPSPTTAPEDRGMMHQELIAKLGVPLGELWNLTDLAEHSRTTGRWDALSPSNHCTSPAASDHRPTPPPSADDESYHVMIDMPSSSDSLWERSLT